MKAKGFSLIELMAVTVITLLLISLSIPYMWKAFWNTERAVHSSGMSTPVDVEKVIDLQERGYTPTTNNRLFVGDLNRIAKDKLESHRQRRVEDNSLNPD